jgi:phosphoribosylformylglycinamidine synthase PurS subunit
VKHSFTVSIVRKPGLSDPEGTTTKKALNDLGFDDVTHVSYGRTISLEVDATTREDALTQVESMCEKLLSNPVMETYTIEARS